MPAIALTAPSGMISATALDNYKGKNITEICPFKYNEGNQCAHFVSHAVGIGIGATCKNASWANKHNKDIANGASIRANEVFNNCPERGLWEKRDASIVGCLIFVTDASNVKNNSMVDVPQKHVGVYLNGTIYHYSNTHGKVETDTPETWLAKFDKIYKGDNISLFYGKFPL